MDRSLSISASAGLLQEKRLDVTATNLANARTTGYKTQRLSTRAQQFEDSLASKIKFDGLKRDIQADIETTPAVMEINAHTDWAPGGIDVTHNPLDVALAKPDEFFVVETEFGQQYTKAGNFTLDSQGRLVTQDGKLVLGQGGAVSLPQGKVQIGENGEIQVDGEAVDVLRVVKLGDLTRLTRMDATRFTAGAENQVEDVTPDLIVGGVEQANSGIVENMVELISANRAFEAYTKIAKTVDELDERAVRNMSLSRG